MEDDQFAQVQSKLADILHKLKVIKYTSEQARSVAIAKTNEETKILTSKRSIEIQKVEQEYEDKKKFLTDSMSYRLRRYESDYDSTIKFHDDKLRELREMEKEIHEILANPRVLSRINIEDRSHKVENMTVEELIEQIVSLSEQARSILDEIIVEHRQGFS